jgi:hypothetical protein
MEQSPFSRIASIPIFAAYYTETETFRSNQIFENLMHFNWSAALITLTSMKASRPMIVLSWFFAIQLLNIRVKSFPQTRERG